MLPEIINGSQVIGTAGKMGCNSVLAQVTTNQDSLPEDLSSLAALNAFYAGFNARDVERSMGLWASTDSVVMCNPMGGIRRGWQNIYAGYQIIMQGAVEVYVEFYDYQRFVSNGFHFFVGRERGTAKANNQTLTLDIRTSRVFEYIDGHWLQVHHHGSMTDPDALAKYQQFLQSALN